MIRTHLITLYLVRCDFCGNQNRIVADGFGTVERALEDAVAHGWQIEDDRHTCSRCLISEPCS